VKWLRIFGVLFIFALAMRLLKRGTEMNHMSEFVYRIDCASSLYEQRLSDKTLRAKRKDGNEKEYPHHQIKKAHKYAPNGTAVFRLCFWKTLEDALNHCSPGWVVQRIKSDHNFLNSCERDYDEYFQDKSAYIFWKTMPVNQKNETWSPEGISHDDIEVLLPDGSWVPMSEVGIFRECDLGWERAGVEGNLTVQFKQKSLPDGNWVFLRQRFGNAPIYSTNPSAFYPLIKSISSELPWQLNSVRWVWSYEMPTQVIARELFIVFYSHNRKGLLGIIDKFRSRKNENELKIMDEKNLDESGIKKLYEGFNVSDILIRGYTWVYNFK
jgi:hypothetical protein